MVTLVELKKAKMNALKEHDVDTQNVLGLVISTYQKNMIEKKAKNEEMTDSDMLSILNKTIKELEDEKAMYIKANRLDSVKSDEKQIAILKAYLPQMMSEEEIREIIEKLEDKSIKNIMTTFKTEYIAKANMSLVSKIAKEYQK